VKKGISKAEEGVSPEDEEAMKGDKGGQSICSVGFTERGGGSSQTSTKAAKVVGSTPKTREHYKFGK